MMKLVISQEVSEHNRWNVHWRSAAPWVTTGFPKESKVDEAKDDEDLEVILRTLNAADHDEQYRYVLVTPTRKYCRCMLLNLEE
jgi:hypothetical protein